MLRLFRIAFETLRFAISLALARLHLTRRPFKPPEQLCLSFTRLGTTFIKFGQALSMRRDILPDEYVAALQSLQDHISSFPTKIAIVEIERGLGRPIKNSFPASTRSRLQPPQLHKSTVHCSTMDAK